LRIMPALKAGSIDAVITSPPYAQQRAKFYEGVSETDYPQWTVSWMAEARRLLGAHGSALINIREHVHDGQISSYVHLTRLALRYDKWIECDELIWYKPSSPPVGHPKRPRRAWERILWFAVERQPWCDPQANGRPSKQIGMTGGHPAWVNGVDAGHSGIARCTDVVEVSTSSNDRRYKHPAPYPVELAAWMIRLVCPHGGTVLDPFMGSGATGVACAQTGRNFIGIESVPDYCSMASQRIEEEGT